MFFASLGKKFWGFIGQREGMFLVAAAKRRGTFFSYKQRGAVAWRGSQFFLGRYYEEERKSVGQRG